MKKKSLFIAVITLVTTLTRCSQTGSDSRVPESDNSTKMERLKLKNTAFCYCVKNATPDSLFKALEDGSLSGYIQTGNHGISAYEAVDSLSREYAKKEYFSKHENKLIFMKCLDFYNSEDLESLIISLDDRIIKN